MLLAVTPLPSCATQEAVLCVVDQKFPALVMTFLGINTIPLKRASVLNLLFLQFRSLYLYS